MPNLKEDVDVYKMYCEDSTISKEEFLKKYKITEKRTFRRKSRRKHSQFRVQWNKTSKT